MDFRPIYDEAVKAGREAAARCVPRPMTVTQRENPFDDHSTVLYAETVLDGVCGFAWITFKGNTPFARWAKTQPDIRVSDWYPSGKCISVSDYDQSMQRKEAHAHAMAGVLREHGIVCSSRSRMD